MNFIDRVRIFVAAGDGGDGCLSFRREKFIEFGGPDGGDGGKGGDVFLEASTSLTTLLDLSLRPHVRATSGANGKGSNKTGQAGADSVVLLPLGSVVYRVGKGVGGGDIREPLADLSTPGQRVLAARGGRGGRGNLSFKSRVRTTPRLCEKGAPGESVVLDMELKLLADVGLVGLPNAGKSSLLARISKARPKVADYPFTTLAPHLGVVSHKGVSFVAADLPGLIEGAREGKGLGIKFLRHAERTRVLVHLVDWAGFGGQGPEQGIKVIESELEFFGADLSRKPRILAVNKMDLPGAREAFKSLAARRRSRRPLALSAATGEGMSALLDWIIQAISRSPLLLASPPEGSASLLPRRAPGFGVEPMGGGVFRLSGAFVERAAAQLDAQLPEAVERFQRALKRIGVDRALKRAGIAEGDAVRCGGFEFEWTDRPKRRLPRLRRDRRTRIGVGKKR